MYWPWVLWGAALVASFAVLEARAFRHPERQRTLSRAIYEIGAKWPLSIWLGGLITGGLAVHFFWHFCPPGSISGG